MFALEFFICDTKGFLQVINLIKSFLNIIRFAVPLLLIVMITIDILKNLINPDNKEGLVNVKKRLIAAIIVFLIPPVIDLAMLLVEVATSSNGKTDYRISSCYINANNECIKKIDDYLECKDYDGDSDCLEFRNCNTYKLENICYKSEDKDCDTSNCKNIKVVTVLDNGSCSNLNKKEKYNKFEINKK